jgi:arginyl-tRNA synthetase
MVACDDNRFNLPDGTSLYLTRDIAGAIERYEKYKFDKMIYVVASQQDLHCAQFIKTLELMGYPWAKTLEHVNFGTSDAVLVGYNIKGHCRNGSGHEHA